VVRIYSDTEPEDINLEWINIIDNQLYEYNTALNKWVISPNQPLNVDVIKATSYLNPILGAVPNIVYLTNARGVSITTLDLDELFVPKFLGRQFKKIMIVVKIQHADGTFTLSHNGTIIASTYNEAGATTPTVYQIVGNTVTSLLIGIADTDETNIITSTSAILEYIVFGIY